MSDVWRILVVEADEKLNRNIVNALQKEGYAVRSVANGADAVRALWSETFVVVVCNLRVPGAGGLELLQWLRAYRPTTHMLLMGEPDQRMQVLENGAAGYLELPLDVRQLREELRRFLQQPGFSADLDSFDLLDVIQMVTMSHRSIALLVNTGLEEHGLLRFQNGELIWAEYGTLRGEEAFFALAAHKNGSVAQQPWNEQVEPNVKQPLSRLIFQAVQYRTKYADAAMQQQSGGQDIDTFMAPEGGEEVDDHPFVMNPVEEIDDTPFAVLAETDMPGPQGGSGNGRVDQKQSSEMTREWWERSSELPRVSDASGTVLPNMGGGRSVTSGSMGAITPAVQKTPVNEKEELPSWLVDQPTTDIPVVMRPPSAERVPSTPAVSSSPQWQMPQDVSRATDPLLSDETPYNMAPAEVFQSSPTVWQQQQEPQRRNTPPISTPPIEVDDLQSLTTVSEERSADHQRSGALERQRSGALAQSKHHYNYPALVSALQTLGYAIGGFVAAAIVSLDGQPVAQVTVDDIDMTPVCRSASSVLQSAVQMLVQGEWGQFEEIVVNSADCRILMRLVGEGQWAFQVLITSREADLVESLNVMANVEGAISAALE
ncbi:MAG: response regulator [Ktedonobacteraceae bacterium]|nr:response regulator [Ktedonobacteraceae bacterium]